MEAINLKAEASKIENLFEYKAIAQMNGHQFTLVKAKNRTLDFHIHPHSDEVFFVLDGQMALEFEDKTVRIQAGEMCVVPKGTRHRPICTSEVTVLLMEREGTLTAENTGGTYKS